jgi:glyceraldehyde 3-phosphate dehydrogenase
MSIKIAINGFGRIGRPVFRRILDSYPNLEVKAINDLTDNKMLAHLLKYDSLYGIYHKPVKYTEEALIINNGQEFKCLAEKEPANLPWQELGIDIVLECTGYFTDLEGAKKHLQAGAKKVILSAPSKNQEVPHFVLGVNQDKYNPEKDDVVSMCSCTTNCLAPIAKILHENFEIESGLMTTIHSYTNGQRLLDLPHKDLRRARAAALSMVPTTTGAAIAVTKAIPELEGKIHGLAIRVPTPVVSLVDFVAKVKKETSVEEVNYIFKKASSQEGLKGILGIEDALLVSIDYKGNSFSSIIDMALTMVQGKDLIKVLAWYDNEWGYACRLAEFTEYIGSKL